MDEPEQEWESYLGRYRIARSVQVCASPDRIISTISDILSLTLYIRALQTAPWAVIEPPQGFSPSAKPRKETETAV